MVIGDGVDTDIQRRLGAIKGLDQLLEALLRWEENGVDKDVGSAVVVVVAVVVVTRRGNGRRSNDMTTVPVVAVVGGIKKSLEPCNLTKPLQEDWQKQNKK
jgi:hypothetical protein